MPSSFKITAALAEAEPPQPPIHATAYESAHDAASPGGMAHHPNPWTGRCRPCGTAYPCQARQSERTGISRGRFAPGHRLLLGLVAVTALLGFVLVAAAMSGLVR